jgi:hypothetical protein
MLEKELFPELQPQAAASTTCQELTLISSPKAMDEVRSGGIDEEKRGATCQAVEEPPHNLLSLASDTYRWLQETFPTVTVVVSHMPFPLVPFALSMFVLVQALVTKGWVPVFAYGWDHWVNKTGTVGAVGGMGFLSVILCNVSTKNEISMPRLG